MMKWISVKDALPKECQDCLVKTKNGSITTADWCDEIDEKECWMHHPPVMGDLWENPIGEAYYIPDVEFWVPIDELYRKTGEK